MKKKITAVALVVALLAVGIIGGTLAYFTDEEAQINTFTMGNVAITLTEPSYQGTNGMLHVYPGQTFAKDPTIAVDANSEDCWLIATVTISNKKDLYGIYTIPAEQITQDTVFQTWGLSLAGNGKMVSGGIAGWTKVGNQDGTKLGTMLKNSDGSQQVFLTYEEPADKDTIVYTFYFKNAQEAGASYELFDTVAIPAIIENGDITDGTLSVTVNAYAIQKEGFTDVYDAWAELNK